MNVPPDLKYSRSDEWLRPQGDQVTIGITDYAQHELGEIVYVELPASGSRVEKGSAFGVVESVKAVSDLVSPVSGEVTEANSPLTDNPSVINNSPYEEGWLIKVRVSEGSVDDELLDAAAYGDYRAAGEH